MSHKPTLAAAKKVLEEMVGRPTRPDIIWRFMTRRFQPMGQLSRCGCVHARVDGMQRNATQRNASGQTHRDTGTKRRRERDRPNGTDGTTNDGRDVASVSRSRLSRCGREVSSHLNYKGNRTEPNRARWISDSPMREASLRLDDDDVDDTGMKARRTYTRGR
jgi:hypothetical protein